MKRVVETKEGPGGLESFLAQEIIVLCQNYFYTGKLTGINTDSIELSNASLVYKTGSWNEKGFKDSQKLPGTVWYVLLSSIESYGVAK